MNAALQAKDDGYACTTQHIVTDMLGLIFRERKLIHSMNIFFLKCGNRHRCEVGRCDKHVHPLIVLFQHGLVHQCLLQVGRQRDGVVHLPHLILKGGFLSWGIGTKRKSIRADPNGQTFIVNLIFCHYSQLPAILLFVSSRSPMRSPYHSPSVWSSLSSINSARFL